jgi:hypothetical protein
MRSAFRSRRRERPAAQHCHNGGNVYRGAMVDVRLNPNFRTDKKPGLPVSDRLRDYLRRYRRESDLPVGYAQLRRFIESIPLADAAGQPTLWETVAYRAEDMTAINEGLKHIYALLRVDGDFSVMRHLYVDRVDFCSFGNSLPFRIRIVNAYNDNQDYFYVKQADASRVYGLELEHLLSPNRLNYLTAGATLVEEHVAGIPGDVFIQEWLHRADLRPIRIAKELVKFNERCFLRLLGDMRSYNFVFIVTPDFEDAQVRIRAMDFDQQSYNGRKNYYLPQFFKENAPLVTYCAKHLHIQTARQYQREEQSLLLGRADAAAARLDTLLDAMSADPLAPAEKLHSLRTGLAAHFKSDAYLRCESMGALIRENLATVRRQINQPQPTAKPGEFL